ncbi:phage tail protein [Herpetosiphon llansteffanensis]|uniref:phage tail protein n=1 Tax=Herpetosiphon llansteffanensis TaxID=2094568 RepID=UPI000D7BAA4E|nr:tail fiber protein [Herpetosiphon llansteffanensis]
MSQPYVGEIRMFASTFAPVGWAFCDGAILPISENETLFQLIGTTYGGDGQSTFGLPDLRGRLPIHQGNGFILAETGGAEAITLTVSQLPAHTHLPMASANNGTTNIPQSGIWAKAGATKLYVAGATQGDLTPFAANTISPIGGSQPHSNLSPYLCINFIISLFGIFPSPT